MTLAQLHNDFYQIKYEEQTKAGEEMRQRILSLSKKPRTDSPRKFLPKLKNESKIKKGRYV